MIVSGADACQRAADIYQCGQEKDPDLVFSLRGKLTDKSSAETVILFAILIKIVSNLSIQDGAVPILATDYRICRFSHLPCVVNVSRKH
jgi:hypothetical protein